MEAMAGLAHRQGLIVEPELQHAEHAGERRRRHSDPFGIL
jgi:hypothetical protein